MSKIGKNDKIVPTPNSDQSETISILVFGCPRPDFRLSLPKRKIKKTN